MFEIIYIHSVKKESTRVRGTRPRVATIIYKSRTHFENLNIHFLIFEPLKVESSSSHQSSIDTIMKRRTGGSTMHAWHPHHDPRSTPPPKSKTKLAASFEEFDREHMRIKLIERSILKAQATRQDRLTEEAQARTLATKAHHAIEAHHNQLSPVRGGHSPVRGGSRRQNHHSRSPNRRKIRLLDHLSKEETLSIEMGLKEVVRMRKHAEEIEKAEIAAADQQLDAAIKRRAGGTAVISAASVGEGENALENADKKFEAQQAIVKLSSVKARLTKLGKKVTLKVD